jgi:hypothetical protein
MYPARNMQTFSTHPPLINTNLAFLIPPVEFRRIQEIGSRIWRDSRSGGII